MSVECEGANPSGNVVPGVKDDGAGTGLCWKQPLKVLGRGKLKVGEMGLGRLLAGRAWSWKKGISLDKDEDVSLGGMGM